MQELVIKNWNVLSEVENLEGAWVTSEELGKHLGYADPRDAINNLYQRNKNFFVDVVDTCTLKLRVQLQDRDVRIFSERGILKILRYSKTELADKVMEEVFDVFLLVRSGKVAMIPEKYINHPEVQYALRYAKIEEEQKRHVQMILEQQQKQLDQQKLQLEQQAKLHVLEAKTEAVLSQSNLFTVIGYANAFGYKNITLAKAAKIGKQATTISEGLGIDVTTVPDPRFGKINQYRKEVLDDLFAQEFGK